MRKHPNEAIKLVAAEIMACCLCPRLVAWREEAAANPPARFRGEEYWARPVPGFGDPKARLLLVGLAPAAHGGNRTGRVFTGDRSGDWLFRALHKAGFANQPTSIHKDDGLKLQDAFITAAARCAPPGNKPLPRELTNCRPFLLREIQLLTNLRVVLGLGKIGFDTAFDALRALGKTSLKSRPKFAHGGEAPINESLTLLGTFHPSQQNTFTGKLTVPMLDAVFARARVLLI
ncbi:MAG: uracil-DNA glycosylase [Pirellulaceae bacterium]|nr:uracil-DNA glycosylase [Pirellulaceae bacterium]